MKTKPFVAGVAMMIAASCAIADESDSDTKPLSFSVAALKPTGDQVKRSAIRAMVQRTWTVETITDSYITGSIKQRKARIDFDAANNVKITGSNGTTANWLKNLKKDIVVELVQCGGI